MTCTLYYRNSCTTFEINDTIQTYGQLQAVVLSYTRLRLPHFQALMFNYEVIGQHLDYDSRIEQTDAKILQLTVNYFPDVQSRLMRDYKRWLRRQILVAPAEASALALYRLYIDLMIDEPLGSLMTISDYRHAPTNRQSIPTRSVSSAVSENSSGPRMDLLSGASAGTLTDQFYYEFYYPVTAGLQEILDQLAPAVTVTLTEEQLADFRVVRYGDSELSTDTDQCAICQESYRETDNVRILRCEHTFHQNCIDHWLTRQSVYCPICRADCR